MSFSADLKQLRKRYISAIKDFYGDDCVALKMLIRRIKYNDLYEADLAFRTCLVAEFSDKNIKRLLDTNTSQAVDKLRARARGCLYAASVVGELLKKQICPAQDYACYEIREIYNELIDKAKQSVELSDKWARDINVEKFDMSEFDGVYEPYSKYLDNDWFCK